MKVIRYDKNYFDLWNDFVMHSENGNFLFHRNFMEYHQDRFKDNSLIIFDDKNNIKALFPANISNNKIYSHQGLTYGGLIFKNRKHIREIISCFYHMVRFYLSQNIEEIIYKPVPNYISLQPNDAEHFIMNLINAKLNRVDTSFVTHLDETIQIQERRKRALKKAQRNKNININIDNNFNDFWKKVLEPNLWERYKAKPIHTLQEILLLHERFPKNILQANAYLNDKIVAGVTLFIFQNTVHCQYISSTDEGRDSGAIDLLFYELILHFQNSKKFFSMGTSNNDGRDLNIGVSEYKEGFGTKIYAHFHYSFNTSNINLLEKYI